MTNPPNRSVLNLDPHQPAPCLALFGFGVRLGRAREDVHPFAPQAPEARALGIGRGPRDQPLVREAFHAARIHCIHCLPPPAAIPSRSISSATCRSTCTISKYPRAGNCALNPLPLVPSNTITIAP